MTNAACLASQLAECPEVLPIARLVLVFHAANCPVEDPPVPRDEEEVRNVRLLQTLLPANRLGLAGVIYKPPRFIHPFNFKRHYSLPGYLDRIVLPYFYRTVDGIAKMQTRRTGAEFLAFVYMFFLLVHPLVDRNGSTARNLLDYYNAKLSLGLTPVWNQNEPKKFSKCSFHKCAFGTFFEKEAALPSISGRDPYDVLDEIRGPVECMADHMIDWAVTVSREPAKLGERASVRAMAAGIRERDLES